MSSSQHPIRKEVSNLFGELRWGRLILIVVALMLTVSLLSQNYSQNVLLPRYCSSQLETLQILQKILTQTRPAGEELRRPYLIAAKLIFLVPQQSNESIPDYLRRVENHLRSQCS